MKHLDTLLVVLLVFAATVLAAAWVAAIGPGGVASVLGVGSAYSGTLPMVARLLGAGLIVFVITLAVAETVPRVRRMAAAPPTRWTPIVNRTLTVLVFGIAGSLTLGWIARTGWAAGVSPLGVGEGYVSWWEPLVKLAAALLLMITGTKLVQELWGWFRVRVLGKPAPANRTLPRSSVGAATTAQMAPPSRSSTISRAVNPSSASN